MRILHIGKYFPPDHGGMETFLHALALEQARNGHEVFILCHGEKAGISRPVPGLTIRRCRTLCQVGGYAPFAPSLGWHVLRQELRADIVHAHCPNAAAAWPAVWSACLPQPVVLHWHADVLFPPGGVLPILLPSWRVLERFMLRRTRRIVVTSRHYLDNSTFLVPYREKCRVIPLALARQPVQPDFTGPAVDFFSAGEGQGHLHILAVGRFSHYKGFEYLIRAMARRPVMRLCLVGEGEEKGRLQRLAGELGLDGRVLFAGSLADAQVRACMQRCDVLALPSIARTEAFGMVLLEAMREGVPCVATDVPGSGMASVVRHGETGLLVPPADDKALGEALNRLADNAALRRRMGAAGRSVWENEYRIQDVAAAMDAVYAECRATFPHFLQEEYKTSSKKR